MVKNEEKVMKKGGHGRVSVQKSAETKPQYSLRLLIAIVEHGRAEEIVELLTSFGIKFHIVCQGEGTANSAFLEFLNLEKSTKDVIINVMDTAKTAEILHEVYESYKGSGIAFTVKMNSIGGMKALQLVRGDFDALNADLKKTETDVKE